MATILTHSKGCFQRYGKGDGPWCLRCGKAAPDGLRVTYCDERGEAREHAETRFIRRWDAEKDGPLAWDVLGRDCATILGLI